MTRQNVPQDDISVIGSGEGQIKTLSEGQIKTLSKCEIYE